MKAIGGGPLTKERYADSDTGIRRAGSDACMEWGDQTVRSDCGGPWKELGLSKEQQDTPRDSSVSVKGKGTQGKASGRPVGRSRTFPVLLRAMRRPARFWKWDMNVEKASERTGMEGSGRWGYYS